MGGDEHAAIARARAAGAGVLAAVLGCALLAAGLRGRMDAAPDAFWPGALIGAGAGCFAAGAACGCVGTALLAETPGVAAAPPRASFGSVSTVDV